MKKLRCIVLLTILVLAVACEHKELCYHHPHTTTIRVEFDWRDAPEANPEGMCVFFYPENSEEEPQRFDFAGKTGGEVTLRVGKYRIITYNNDTEVVQFRRTFDGFELHEGFTREGSALEPIYGNTASYTPRAAGAEEERVVICPDMLWGCAAQEVEITERGVSYICVPESEKEAWLGQPATNTEQVITLYPHEQICIYTYEIRNVQHLKYAIQMCCTLSGMAGSLFLGPEELDCECVTVPFAAESDNESTISGRFYTFGHHEENTEAHKLVLYIWMRGESKGWCYTFDVTDQVHAAPNKRRVHLVVDGLELPKPIDNGGGFHPSVDDWVVVEENIVM